MATPATTLTEWRSRLQKWQWRKWTLESEGCACSNENYFSLFSSQIIVTIQNKVCGAKLLEKHTLLLCMLTAIQYEEEIAHASQLLLIAQLCCTRLTDKGVETLFGSVCGMGLTLLNWLQRHVCGGICILQVSWNEYSMAARKRLIELVTNNPSLLVCSDCQHQQWCVRELIQPILTWPHPPVYFTPSRSSFVWYTCNTTVCSSGVLKIGKLLMPCCPLAWTRLQIRLVNENPLKDYAKLPLFSASHRSCYDFCMLRPTSQAKYSVCMQVSRECCPACVRIPEPFVRVSTAAWYATKCWVTSHDTSTAFWEPSKLREHRRVIHQNCFWTCSTILVALLVWWMFPLKGIPMSEFRMLTCPKCLQYLTIWPEVSIC